MSLCGGTSSDVEAVVADADAALAVDTDFDAVVTGQWSIDMPETQVHVTLNMNDVGTGYEPNCRAGRRRR